MSTPRRRLQAFARSLSLLAALVATVPACQTRTAQPPARATATKSVATAAGEPARDHAFDLEERARQQRRAAAVEILRDDFGVPHVYGQTDADAVFGLLYAQAEDDFPRVERNYVWAIGRLAELEGERALYSDLRARLFMTHDEARAHYESAPTWLKELCVAFADGLNFYLATHPEVTPRLLTRFEPWMPMYFFEGSIGGDIEQVPLAGIEAFYGQHRAAPRRSSRSGQADEPRGSNGLAIAGSRTASGRAMLLINPHTSFYFRGEAHVVSEQGLNAYGAVTWGQFFIYQGFNEHNGWMHTTTYADFMDEFVEDVVEEDGALRYRYGEELREVERGRVTLRYRAPDGALARREFPTYRTHHGPITGLKGDKWVATKLNWDPARALEQSYRRTKTRDHAEFRRLMELRTNSSNNTVYADRDGTIAYYHGNFMPRRDPRFDYDDPVDGSDPRTDWRGLHRVDEIIQLVNPPSGWLQNCNSTPFTAAAEHSPAREDYPAYMARDPETFRAVHATRLLQEKGRALTLDGLIALAYDPALPAFELLIPGVVEAFEREGGDERLREAIALLRAWDHRVDVDSAAMTIAHFYGEQALARVKQQPGSRMARLERFARGAPRDQLSALADALVAIEEGFGARAIPWGQVNRLQRLSGAVDAGFDDAAPSLPIGLASGRWGALAAFGARAGDDTNRIYGYRGNSFVAVVEFGDRVRAKSLLAGGQSGDPASPHFFDQGARYQRGEFKEVAYYREDVEARAARRYHPGERG